MNVLRFLVIGALLTGLGALSSCSSGGSGGDGTSSQVKAPNPPTVTNVSPSTGPRGGNSTVVITGEGFLDDPNEPERLKVFFGLEEARDVLLISSTSIRVLTPEHAPGTVDIKVVNDDNSTFLFPQAYTYVADTFPLVTSVAPVTGPNYGLTKVTVKGNNFEKGCIVRFGGAPSQQVTLIDSQTLEALTPYGPTGTVGVQVENPNHQVSALQNAFTYQDFFRINGTSFKCDLDRLTPGRTNHPINLSIWIEFNRDLELGSFNENTFSLKTSLGKKATGKFTVSGNKITFNPDVKFVNNTVVFGFLKGANYILSIPGATQGSTLRAKGGAPLNRGLVWEINTSLDPLDFNNAPPSMSLKVPVVPDPKKDTARLDTEIVLLFDEVVMPNEIIDPSAIIFEVEVPGYANRLPVEGTRSAGVDVQTGGSFLKFVPKNLLPSLSKVHITADPNKLHDVVGKPLNPATTALYFLTESGAGYKASIVEDFADQKFLEWSHTCAPWGSGKLTPGRLGGSGELGSLDVASGTVTLNTDNQVFPANQTLTGKAITVTDGIFRFANLRVAAGATLTFTGSRIPKVMVAGSAEIDGRVVLNGGNAPDHSGTANTGGPGGKGGVGGAAGGAGGSKPGSGKGAGTTGSPLPVPAGHPRSSQAAATAGQGSLPNPHTGGVPDATKVTYSWYSYYSQQVAGGGGGGGFMTAGGLGTAKVGLAPLTEAGPGGVGGTVFPLLPLATTLETTRQFPFGGSGGGGAGCHALGSDAYTAVKWESGAGGGGGGGALTLQVGGDLGIRSNAVFEAKGGAGGGASGSTNASPGGGGSGGAFLFQIVRNFSTAGKVDVSGGLAKVMNDKLFIGASSTGGRGGAGHVLVETNPITPVSALTGFTPAATAANAGLLTESDPVTSARSLWYNTLQVKATWLHYEVKVRQGTQTVVYSDDSTLGTVPVLGTTPVAIFLQGTVLDQNSKPGAISDWVSKSSDLNTFTPNPLAVRFRIVLDRSKLPVSQTFEVLEVKMTYNL